MNGSSIFTPAEKVGLRLSLDERYQNVPDTELYELVSSRLQSLTPEQAEGFWSAAREYGSKVLNVGQQALPGVIQGATAGSALGPWGTFLGAVGGGVGSALSGSRGPQMPPAPQMPAKPTGLAQPVNNTPAAAQLLQLIQDPRISQALSSLIMGASGSKTIPVAGSQVAPGDFLNLLSTLATSAIKQAGEAYAENALGVAPGDSSPEFESIPEFDQANSEHRAEYLSGLLQREQESFRTQNDPFQEFISRLEGGNFVMELTT